MKQLIPDDVVRNKAADAPWKKSETDHMLDLYFGGAHPKRIAHDLQRNPKAIERALEMFISNERDRAVFYRPFRRVSRRGKRITENEKLLISSHRKKRVGIAVTALVLARALSEIDGHENEIKETRALKELAPMLDLIWAHRYIYFVYKKPVISDSAYDDMVKEEVEYGGGGPAFADIKDHRGWPERIRSLALYLVEKAKDGQ